MLHFVTRKVAHISSVCLLAALLALAFGAAPAAAKQAPCWKTLINDWYDGRIDGTYAIPCYRQALKHLPTDVQTYSSARDDIRQALQQRILQGKNATKGGGGAKGGGGTSGPSGTTGPTKGGGGTSGPAGTTGPSGTTEPGGTTGPGKSGGTGGTGTKPGGRNRDGGVAGDIIRGVGPDKADSVPLPLIILGAIALLLMAAGAAGFVARRMRTRRLQLAALPAGPHELPPGPRELPPGSPELPPPGE